MIENFPYLNENLRIIHKYNSVIMRDISTKSLISLNYDAFSILRECNGINSFKQIILNAAKDCSGVEDINAYIDGTASFFKELSEHGYILYTETPSEKTINIIDAPDICYPNNIAFELTDYCNLNCKHCYRNSNSKKTEFIDAERLLAAIAELSNYGLRSIHLTGGEPGAHKDFVKILTGALDFCSKVIIISNGTCFNEQAVEVFAANKGRIKIQVDLDGPNESVHDELRGVKGAFNSVTRFIKEAAAHGHGITVDIAMNIYRENFDYIEETIELSKKLGASSFSISMIMDCGRAEDIELLDDDQSFRFITLLPELYEKYEGFIRKPEASAADMEKRLNCGGGHKNIVSSPNGDLRSCVMLPEGILGMGNLFAEKADELFSKPIFKHFADLQAPNKEVCGECAYVNSCLGCFARVLLSEDKMKAAIHGFECTYKKNILF